MSRKVGHGIANDANTDHHLEKEIRLARSDVCFPDMLNVAIQLGLVPRRGQKRLNSVHFETIR